VGIGPLDSGAGDSGPPASGPEPVEPPALEDIFRDINGDGVVGDVLEPGGERAFFFDDARLRALCLVPDADSFDDYEEVDPTSGCVIVPRTTPLSTTCPADGIATGPLHEELLPSSWCRINNCEPVDGSPARRRSAGAGL